MRGRLMSATGARYKTYKHDDASGRGDSCSGTSTEVEAAQRLPIREVQQHEGLVAIRRAGAVMSAQRQQGNSRHGNNGTAPSPVCPFEKTR